MLKGFHRNLKKGGIWVNYLLNHGQEVCFQFVYSINQSSIALKLIVSENQTSFPLPSSQNGLGCKENNFSSCQVYRTSLLESLTFLKWIEITIRGPSHSRARLHLGSFLVLQDPEVEATQSGLAWK